MYAKFSILIIHMFCKYSYVLEMQKGDFQKFMYLMYLTYEKSRKKHLFPYISFLIIVFVF